MRIEWDTVKAEANLEKHGVSFQEAAEIVSGIHVEFKADVRGEKRTKAIGRIMGVYITVIYTQREQAVRIISARLATQRERSCYDKYLD